MRLPNQSAGVIRSAPGTPLRGGVIPSIIWGVVIGFVVGSYLAEMAIAIVVHEIEQKD